MRTKNVITHLTQIVEGGDSPTIEVSRAWLQRVLADYGDMLAALEAARPKLAGTLVGDRVVRILAPSSEDDPAAPAYGVELRQLRRRMRRPR